VFETVKLWCETADAGFRTVFDNERKIFTFELYRGRKTSCIFAKEFENLLSAQYTESVADFSNAALVKGEGEGGERAAVTVFGGDGKEPSGKDRFELYVDAKDLQSEQGEDTPPIPEADYRELLIFRGMEKLAQRAHVLSFDAAVNTHGNLRYKADFDLGDTVKVQSKEWGAELDAQITEITEFTDGEGVSLDLVFGNSLLTLTQKLRKGF
jgi:hypothetical protein